MAVIISKTEINWGDAFFGFVPSKTVFQSGGLYTCECLSRSPRVDGSIVLTLNAPIAAIGIIGATVMPHSLFLGSALATQDREASSPREAPASRDADAAGEGTLPSVRNARTLVRRLSKSFMDMFKIQKIADKDNEPKSHADWTNNPLTFIRRHLAHGVVDMVVSLLGLAVVINALCVPSPGFPR